MEQVRMRLFLGCTFTRKANLVTLDLLDVARYEGSTSTGALTYLISIYA